MGKLQAAGGDEKPGKSLIRYLPLAGQGQIPDPQKLTWGWSNLRYHTWSILGCHNEKRFSSGLDIQAEHLLSLAIRLFFTREKKATKSHPTRLRPQESGKALPASLLNGFIVRGN